MKRVGSDDAEQLRRKVKALEQRVANLVRMNEILKAMTVRLARSAENEETVHPKDKWIQ